VSGDHFEKTDQSPELPEGDHGILIDATASPTIYGEFNVRGAFHLPAQLANDIGRPLQRSVVLVIQREHGNRVVAPFKDNVLFGDDDRLTPDGLAGYFNVDVFAAQKDRVEGNYHLFVSLGEHISNVVQRTVSRA
jgi:hypothetical protein